MFMSQKDVEEIKYTFDIVPDGQNINRGVKQFCDNCITRGSYQESGINYITKEVCLVVAVDHSTSKYYYRNVLPSEVLKVAISRHEVYNAPDTAEPLSKPYVLEDVFKVGEYAIVGGWDKNRVIGSTPTAPYDSSKNVAVIQSIDSTNWTVNLSFINTSDSPGQELLNEIISGAKQEVSAEDVPIMSPYPYNLSEGLFSLKAMLRSSKSYYYNYDITHPTTFKEDLKGLVVFIGDITSGSGLVRENNTIIPPNDAYYATSTNPNTAVGFISEVRNKPEGGDYIAKVTFFRNEAKDTIENFPLKGTKFSDPLADNFPDVNSVVRANVLYSASYDRGSIPGLIKTQSAISGNTDKGARLGFYNTIKRVTGSGANRENPIFLRQYAPITNLRYMEYVISKIDYPIN